MKLVTTGTIVPSRVDVYELEINKAKARTLKTLLELSKKIAKANEVLEDDEWFELLKRTGFSKATVSKYLQIGKCTRLHNSRTQAHLPSKVSVLYVLSKISNETFDKALEAGIVSPTMERERFEQWLLTDRSQPAAAQDSNNRVGYFVPPDKGMSPEAWDAFEKAFLSLCSSHGVKPKRQIERGLKPCNAAASRESQRHITHAGKSN
jgi:hypothetical protein